eukprot:2192321-Rhodomonas_salina.2
MLLPAELICTDWSNTNSACGRASQKGSLHMSSNSPAGTLAPPFAVSTREGSVSAYGDWERNLDCMLRPFDHPLLIREPLSREFP